MSRPPKTTVKPVKSPRGSSKKSRGSTLTGVFIGLVVGVIVAAGVVVYMNRSTVPFQDRGTTTASDGSGKKPDAPVVANTSGTPDPLPGKPGDKAGEKPRFEFYNILPGKQDAAPDPQAPPAASTEAPAQAAANETFYLQVGAFQKAPDADNVKAKLALLGIEASIQEVTTADKGKLLRVRAGPFAKPEEMNKARNELAANGIQATVIKIKDAAISTN